MTGQRETTRYASPSFRLRSTALGASWIVTAYPWSAPVGLVKQHDAGWTAHATNGRYAGLWPTKQAAGEQLVKQAGYELEME